MFTRYLIIASLALGLGFSSYGNPKERKKLLKHWEEVNDLGNPIIYKSRQNPSLTAVILIEERQGKIPTSVKEFKKWEKTKKELIQKLPGVTNWTAESYSWDKKDKTLRLKGFFMKKKKKIYFKEWIFYGKTGITKKKPWAFDWFFRFFTKQKKEIVKIYARNLKKFDSSDDKRISVLLSTVK